MADGEARRAWDLSAKNESFRTEMDHPWGERQRRCGMIKTRRRSPTMNPLPFQLDPEPANETLTSYGGVPLVIQAFRSLGLPQAIHQHLMHALRVEAALRRAVLSLNLRRRETEADGGQNREESDLCFHS